MPSLTCELLRSDVSNILPTSCDTECLSKARSGTTLHVAGLSKSLNSISPDSPVTFPLAEERDIELKEARIDTAVFSLHMCINRFQDEGSIDWTSSLSLN